MTTTLPAVDSESTISNTPSRQSRWRPRATSAAVWLIPGLATLVIGRKGLGGVQFHPDEAATLGIAHRSVEDILRMALNMDGVVALYYVLMHFWIRLFGDSEFSMRFPSLLFIAAAVGLTAVLGRRLFNARVGFLAGLILAVVPSITYYAQMARPYGFTLFAGVLCSWALLRAFDRGTRGRWVAYALAVAAMAYANIIAAGLMLAAHGVIVLLWWYRDRHRAVVMAWIAAAAGGLVPAVPLLWLGLHEHDRQLWWITPPTFENFIPQLSGMMYVDAGVAAVLFGLALGARGPKRRNLAFVATLAVLPQILLPIAGLFTEIWLPRYHFFALAFMALLAATTLARNVPLAIAGLVLLAFIGAPTQKAIRSPLGERFMDYRTMALVVQTNARPGDAIAYQNNVEWALRPLIESKVSAAQLPPAPLIAQTGAQAADLFSIPCLDSDACLRGFDRVWLVYADGAPRAPFVGFGPADPVLNAQFTFTGVWKANLGSIVLAIRKS